MSQNDKTRNEKIKVDRVGITPDRLTSRAYLTLFIEDIGVYPLLECHFSLVLATNHSGPVLAELRL